MIRFSLRLVLCLVAAVACHARDEAQPFAAPRNALRVELLGCYALYMPNDRLLDSTFYNASPLVRLDSAPLGISGRDTMPGVFRVFIRLDKDGSPLEPVDPQNHIGHAWWADSLSDSIRVSFSDGFSGAVVILAAPPAAHDTLRGRIEEHWDVGPTITGRGMVRAIRIRCSDGAA